MGVTRYLSFVEEPTFGVAVTTGGETIDPESAELDPSGDQAYFFEGVSRLDRIVAPGNYMSGGSITTPFDLKAFPWFLKWALGGYEVTGTAPSFTHRFFPQQDNLMKSFTARVGKDVFEHIFSGCVVGSISLELDDNFLIASVDVLGGKDEKAALQVNPTFTTGEIYAPHQVTASIDSTDVSANVERFSLTIETGADNEGGITIGSRFPRRAYRGAFVVTGEIGLSFFDTSNLEAFWGTATGPTQNVLSEKALTINVGNNIDIIIPRFVYTAMTQPLSGRERIEQTASIRALVKADGTGPIEFSVTNDKPSYTAA